MAVEGGEGREVELGSVEVTEGVSAYVDE